MMLKTNIAGLGAEEALGPRPGGARSGGDHDLGPVGTVWLRWWAGTAGWGNVLELLCVAVEEEGGAGGSGGGNGGGVSEEHSRLPHSATPHRPPAAEIAETGRHCGMGEGGAGFQKAPGGQSKVWRARRGGCRTALMTGVLRPSAATARATLLTYAIANRQSSWRRGVKKRQSPNLLNLFNCL